MGLTTKNDQTVYRPRGKMIIDNFLGGLAWSAGTIIGGTILLLLVGLLLHYLLRNVNFVPLIGGWLHDILQSATQSEPNLPIKHITPIR